MPPKRTKLNELKTLKYELLIKLHELFQCKTYFTDNRFLYVFFNVVLRSKM